MTFTTILPMLELIWFLGAIVSVTLYCRITPNPIPIEALIAWFLSWIGVGFISHDFSQHRHRNQTYSNLDERQKTSKP